MISILDINILLYLIQSFFNLSILIAKIKKLEFWNFISKTIIIRIFQKMKYWKIVKIW